MRRRHSPASVEDRTLNALATLLAWPRLHRHVHTPSDDPEISWYSAEHAGVTLQINTRPRYNIAIYSHRHSIFTGFQRIRFPSNASDEILVRTARRLCHLMHRSWFDDATSRREFRKLNPECERRWVQRRAVWVNSSGALDASGAPVSP